jgi:hypothetical protein
MQFYTSKKQGGIAINEEGGGSIILSLSQYRMYIMFG